MPASEMVDADVPSEKHQPAVSHDVLMEGFVDPHAMWLLPVIFGLSLLAVAAIWFSMLGAYYSTGLENGADSIGTIVGALASPF